MFPKRGEKKDREGRREREDTEKREREGKKGALGYFELITHSSLSSSKASPFIWRKKFRAKLVNTLEVLS